MVEKEAEKEKEQSDGQPTVFPISEAPKIARENSRQRKFEQTWDFIINLRGLDLKKPENRFKAEIPLPKGRGKEPKTLVFADLMANDAKKHADMVITKAEMGKLASDKKKLRKLADEYDFFFGEAPLMPEIGKSMGTVLGPRGKVPKPIPPKADIGPIINASKRMVRISLKSVPVVYVSVGSEKMKNEDVAANARAVYAAVRDKLPKGTNNIKSVLLKLTMGKPVKVTMD